MKSAWCWSAPAIPVSEEAAETIWHAVNTVSTCQNTLNFAGLEIATDMVANVTKTYKLATKHSSVVATLATMFPL